MKLKSKVLGLIAAVTAILLPSPAQAAGDADALLDKVVEWCKEKRSVEADYTITTGGESFAGTMIVNGDRFSLKSAIIDSWYDGKTQWTYNPQTNEVSISEPTGDEIQQINPFAIINAFRHAYNVETGTTKSPKNNKLVLTPKDKGADISRVEIIIPKSALYPARITMKLTNGETCVLDMKRFVRGVSYDNSTFTYDPSSHPKAKTVDLR